MTGPKYPGVEAHNMYNPVNERPPLTDQPMTGPVYPGVEASNKYNPKSERVVHGTTVHCGPGKMEGVDESNKYCPVPDRRPGEPMLSGPVYHGVKAQNSYVPPTDKVHGDPIQTGPKRPGESSITKIGLKLIKIIKLLK